MKKVFILKKFFVRSYFEVGYLIHILTVVDYSSFDIIRCHGADGIFDRIVMILTDI